MVLVPGRARIPWIFIIRRCYTHIQRTNKCPRQRCRHTFLHTPFLYALNPIGVLTKKNTHKTFVVGKLSNPVRTLHVLAIVGRATIKHNRLGLLVGILCTHVLRIDRIISWLWCFHNECLYTHGHLSLYCLTCMIQPNDKPPAINMWYTNHSYLCNRIRFNNYYCTCKSDKPKTRVMHKEVYFGIRRVHFIILPGCS